MKTILKLLLIFIVLMATFSCKEEKKNDRLTIATVNNPNLLFATGMSTLYPEKYSVRVVRSPMEMTTLLSKNENPLVFHTFLGSLKLYKKGAATGYRMYKPYIYNAVHIVSRKPFSSLEDLKGEKIHIAYRGGTPDIKFTTALKQNSMKPSDFDLVYSKPVPIVQLFLSKKADIVILPEIFVSKILNKNDSAVEKWTTQSLENFFDKNALSSPLPDAVILYRANDPNIDMSRIGNDINNTMIYLNEKTKKFSEDVAGAYNDKYAITIKPALIQSAIASKRLVYTLEYDNNDITPAIEILMGNSSKFNSFIQHK